MLLNAILVANLIKLALKSLGRKNTTLIPQVGGAFAQKEMSLRVSCIINFRYLNFNNKGRVTTFGQKNSSDK